MAGTASCPALEHAVTVEYVNYRGERAERRIVPVRIWFGSTTWHPEPQWLLEAYDIDKDTYRSFAMRHIVTYDVQNRGHDVPRRPGPEVASARL